MSLRQASCSTPQQLDANRRNAQHSTGPRSQAGKQRMRMNALKHGCDAAPQHDAEVMRALGEDPQQYEALKQELSAAFGLGDGLCHYVLDDLGRLSWQRRRLERIGTGLMREALERLEERRRNLARSLASVTFDATQGEAVALEQAEPTHPLVRRRLLISVLGVILDQVRRRVFGSQQRSRVESFYNGQVGWRPKQMCHLLLPFANWAFYQREQDPAGAEKCVKKEFGSEAGFEACRQELMRLLEEQLAVEEAAFAEEMVAQDRKEAIAGDACLAPEGKIWEMLLKQEAALDRSIDRKVRILLTMRKEQALGRDGSRSAPTLAEGSPPGEELNDREADEVAPKLSSADAKVSGTAVRTESLAVEDGGDETPKSPEQSQNVIENKGPAAAEVAA